MSAKWHFWHLHCALFHYPWVGEGSFDAQISLVPALMQGQERQLLSAAISVTGDTPGDALRELYLMCWALRGLLECFGSYLNTAYYFVGINLLKIQQEWVPCAPKDALQLRKGLQENQSLQGHCQSRQKTQHTAPLSCEPLLLFL